MKQLNTTEVVAMLSLWREAGARCFGMLNTLQQFALGICVITEANDQRIVVTMLEVMKCLTLAPEPPINEAVFAPADIISAWQSTMFEQPNAGFLGEHFDETLQLVVRRHVTGVNLYHVSQFHKTRARPAG